MQQHRVSIRFPTMGCTLSQVRQNDTSCFVRDWEVRNAHIGNAPTLQPHGTLIRVPTRISTSPQVRPKWHFAF